MREVLLYLSLKYNGNFKKIYDGLKNKELINGKLYAKLKKQLKYDYITILDDDYPDSLKDINCPPFVLFYKGDINLINKECYTILGTESYAQDSISATHTIASGLIKKSYTLISNAELGLNQQVHSTAFNANHKSICILPYMSYKENDRYYLCNIDKAGLVVSERPFFREDLELFMQNESYRIMIGLSKGLIITECDLERDKDSDIFMAVKYTLEQNKDIYCVPASFKSNKQGTNILIQNGAILLRSVNDVC